jgi:nucleoid-associated protein YgaU
MKSKLSAIVVISVVMIALLALSGCCRKPPKEVGEAETAVAQAKESCAEQYAPDEYKKAYDALSMAQQYAKDRKCKNAKKSALEAIQLASEAEQRAKENEAKYEAEADEMISKIKADIQSVESAWADLEKKKTEAESKRAQVLKDAEEKEFAKFGVTIDLPPVTIDTAPKSKIAEAKAKLDEIIKMKDGGTCNLLDVLAELKNFPDLSGVKGMIADMSAKLDQLMKTYEDTLKEKMVDLDTAKKPYMHTVIKGECLWKIAEKDVYYGNPFMWPLIWWDNKWTEEKAQSMSKEDTRNLIKDPDLIFPGQMFKIKKKLLLVESEIVEAEKYAKNRYGTTDWRDIPDFLTDGK